MLENEQPDKAFPVTEHVKYVLLWELAEEAKERNESAEACWQAIMNAFWDGLLPALFVFATRKDAAPGRDLMPLPSRDVLAAHLLGRVNRINGESAGAVELSIWIAELHGWTFRDYRQQPEPIRTYVARNAPFGLAVKRSDADKWRAKRPKKEQNNALAPQAPEGREKRRRRRPGPEPGKLRRFDKSDANLFPELEQIMADQHKSVSAAARVLAEADRIKGIGTRESRAKRLAALYSASKKTNRCNSL